MRESIDRTIPKWPFFIGDLLLLGTAYGVYAQARLPMSLGEVGAATACVGLGAILGVLPFVLEYRWAMRLAEVGDLGSVVTQIQKLETLAARISAATAQWEGVQGQADKTLQAAKGIADRMTAEMHSFAQFFERMNEGEKGTLRVEVEKLRRAEADWLQVLVHVLDHVHAVYQGAVRSGQPRLVEQMGHFQSACRDIARRVGVAAFVAEPAERFDPQRHQLVDGEPRPEGNASVAETLATGYTFQGRLIRPALVRLNGVTAPHPGTPAASGLSQSGDSLPAPSAPTTPVP